MCQSVLLFRKESNTLNNQKADKVVKVILLKMMVEGHCHCCSGVFPTVNSLLVALTADTKLQAVEKSWVSEVICAQLEKYQRNY